MNNKKVPGPDGIPAEVYKLVFQHRPDLLLGAFNACLKEGIFPARWKVARLALIHKGKGDPVLPSSYRPLCMLDTAGKVPEKHIRSRLAEAIRAARDLSPGSLVLEQGDPQLMLPFKLYTPFDEQKHITAELDGWCSS